jgi:hypothetical protein
MTPNDDAVLAELTRAKEQLDAAKDATDKIVKGGR